MEAPAWTGLAIRRQRGTLEALEAIDDVRPARPSRAAAGAARRRLLVAAAESPGTTSESQGDSDVFSPPTCGNRKNMSLLDDAPPAKGDSQPCVPV
jgi:hypothetical protein